jgi:hypothetical protein
MASGLVIGNRRIKTRAGRCYELSGRAMLNEPGAENWTLVHGKVFGPHGMRMGHAWILDGDTVYCAVLDCWMPLREYRFSYCAIEERSYTHKEFCQKMSAERHWGPWHEPGE